MIRNWKEYIKESFKKMDSTREDVNKYTEKLVDEKIEEIFNQVHREFNTESGDISPTMNNRLFTIKEDITDLITNQVCNNLGSDFKKIRSSEIDINVLKKLTDERHNIRKGDRVIAVYFEGHEFGIYLFTTQEVDDTGPGWDDPDDFHLGFSDGGTWYELNEAYLVISLETYNDFVDPEKRLD